MKQLIGYLITISILLSQDILTTKAGNVYEGNLISHTTGDVDFISKGVHHSLPTSMVQRLVLEDGTVLIRNSLTLEEYQKLSTKEKAIYDAKSKNLDKWALYGSISPIIISVYNEVMYWTGGPRISIAFSAAIVTIQSYFVLNHQEKFNFPKSILTDSEKEIYEQAYSKELQKRKFIHFLGCSIVTGVAGSLMAGSSTRGFSMSGFDVRFE